MRKLLLLFIILQISQLSMAQEIPLLPREIETDSGTYLKTTEYTEKRGFKEKLESRYKDKSFVYTEEEVVETKPTDLSFLKFVVSFMQRVFPFLLVGFIVFVILKLCLGDEIGFWNFKKAKKNASKLMYQEEDLHEIDLEKALAQAILEKNHRRAVRFYYLSTLKELSNKKMIDYHKDKTNEAYTYELEKGNIRDQFSYLTYVYAYVWYGEFPLNSVDFITIQKKYHSFNKAIFK